MSIHRIQQYKNLVFSEEAFLNGIANQNVCPDARRKIFEALALLDSHGTDKNYLGKKIQNTKRSGFWELKVKGQSKTEWRFLFKHLSGSEYAIIHFFIKKDEKIRKRDITTAERITAREGW
ncbi:MULTISPECIES: type II toxin-antitoxin system RelE/ParE family toxin [unclassified Paenibacillus]|uniref:type II toxin-antitoxin system RelE/ParE family toxin n=1 Tax=unclassified Paenibacillus TaxID=185978 RepID=UPI0038389851